MNNFTPRSLYIKCHNVTGVKYFGQTTKDPYEYPGSGKYWKSHIKKHGNDVSTKWSLKFTDPDDIREFAEFFSEFYNIVESNEWANLMAENGHDGSPVGRKLSKPRSKEYREKQSIKHSGKIISDEHKAKISKANKGKSKTFSEEHCKNISNSKLGHSVSEETKAKIAKSTTDETRLLWSQKAKLAKGAKWYNDGVNSYLVRDYHEINPLWIIGRIYARKKHN